MRIHRLLSGLLIMGALAAPPVLARERSEVPERLTWDLKNLFPSLGAWKQAADQVATRLPGLASGQGHVGDSAQALYSQFSTLLEIRRDLDRVSVYANLLYDQDTRDSKHLEMRQTVQQLNVQFDSASAYFRPEIQALGKAKLDQYLASEPRLKAFAQVFDDILRTQSHTLTPAEEKIIAEAGDLKESGRYIYGVFSNAELPYPEITLKGKKIRLDSSAYSEFRAASDRKERVQVFQTFFGRYQEYRRSLGTMLYSQVKGHVFDKKVHHYDSCLQAALFPENIPTQVYTQLLADVHSHLPTLHRYLKLRQRLMKVDKLQYSDIYAPIIKGAALHYTPEEAMELTLQASAPLGPDYQKTLKQGYRDRWVDFLPSTGKRSGAYSEGAAYQVHPYQLLNFNGRYEDISTLAHESGHSMHSYLSNRHQPFGLHNYSIFVAEVASTLNENLLLHYMLEHTQDDNIKLFLLSSYLERMRGTLFRQAMLAEFQLKIHEMAEKGQSLTGDNLNALYLRLLKEYYGHDLGVCHIDDLYSVEWAYIPHFYYNFYVYQYATSQVASTSLAAAILAEERSNKGTHRAREAYLKMLSSGSSNYPVALLREAGVDMLSSAPFNAAMKEMNQIMDEIEAISAKH